MTTKLTIELTPEDEEWLHRQKRNIVKHYGMGPHPGTMSPQSVHGGATGGSSGGKKLKKLSAGEYASDDGRFTASMVTGSRVDPNTHAASGTRYWKLTVDGKRAGGPRKKFSSLGEMESYISDLLTASKPAVDLAGIKQSWQDMTGGYFNEVSYVPVDQLTSYQEHDRTIDQPGYAKTSDRVNDLAADIKANGWNEPVMIEIRPIVGGTPTDYGTEGMADKKALARLIEGNHRLAAAKQLGMTHVPATVLAVDYHWSDYAMEATGVGQSPPKPIQLTVTMESAWRGSGYRAPHKILDMKDIIDPDTVIAKGQPGVDDVHIPSTIKTRRKRRRRLRDLLKHAATGPGGNHPSGSSQDVHGRRAEGSEITWTDRPHIPVTNVKKTEGKTVLGTSDMWIVTVAETDEPVIAFRGMTSLEELRDGLTEAWPKWASRGHVVHLEDEKGTSFSVYPDEVFGTSAIQSWVTGEYGGELYAVQVAVDLRGLQGVTLREPVDGVLDANRGLGLSIIEDIPIDRVVAIRTIEKYPEYREELYDLGPRPQGPTQEQVRSSEWEAARDLPWDKQTRAFNQLTQRTEEWDRYFDEKSEYDTAARAVSDRYKGDGGYVEYRGPEAHQFIAMGRDLDPRTWTGMSGFSIYQGIETEAEFSPYGVLKHASPIHPGTGTGQEVHAGGEGSFRGGHTQYRVVGGSSPEQRAADLKTATDRLAEGKPLYRGMGVVFPDDLKAKLSKLLESPMEEADIPNRYIAGRLILDYVTQDGIGRHWTTSKRWAGIAADRSGGLGMQRDQWNVIVEIEPPDPSAINPVQDRMGMSEGEVTLDPNGVFTYKSLIVQGATTFDNYNILETPITKRDIRKHYGPGPHPGTMSPQTVHGSGMGGGGEVADEASDEGAVPIRDRVRPWDGKALVKFNELWNPDGEEVREETQRGISRVMELMREDPRWGEAEEQWLGLEDSDTEMFDAIYNEAEALQSRTWSAMGEMGVGWDDWQDEPPGSWELGEIYKAMVIRQGDDANEYDTEKFALEIDSVEGLIDSTESVHTTTEVTEEFFPGHSVDPVNRNARWGVVGVDPDTGMVTLERRAELDPDGGGPFGDGLGPNETLGPLLGGEGSAMGPERKRVDYKTLFTEDRHPDGGVFMVMDDATYAVLGGEINSLGEDLDQFETNYGPTAHDAVSYIEMGEYEVFTGNIDPSHSEALIVNDSYNKTGMQVAASADDVPMVLRNLWANTSADEHRWAIALQQAVADEFDLDTVPMSTLNARTGYFPQEVDDTYGSFDTGLRVYARAVYNATQEYLAENAPFEGDLPVVRGMNLDNSVVLAHYPDIPQVGSLSDPQWTPIEATLNPLSAFSSNTTTARAFAGRGTNSHPTLVRAWVPPEQIWGISVLGHGSYNEAEVIVLGGDDSLVAEMKIKGWPKRT